MNATEQDQVDSSSFMGKFSDEEIARLMTAETSDRLDIDDEYVDLREPRRGVQRAMVEKAVLRRVVPRKALDRSTWSKVVAQVDEMHAEERKAASRRVRFLDLVPPLREVASMLWRMTKQTFRSRRPSVRVPREERKGAIDSTKTAAPVGGE